MVDEDLSSGVGKVDIVHTQIMAGMVSVVEGLTGWTTLGGRTTDGSPGTDGDGTEMACCGTRYKAGGGVTTGSCGLGTSGRGRFVRVRTRRDRLYRGR